MYSFFSVVDSFSKYIRSSNNQATKRVYELYTPRELVEKSSDYNEIIITNIRHKNQIELAIKNIEEAKEAVLNNLPIDIISISIKQSLEDLGKITGQNVSEDIINEIFSKFCLGK